MLLVLSCLLLCFGFTKNHETVKNPIVILLSFDGFRWDYIYKTETPTLRWLAKNGVSATILNNFVTKTFPNHYSIVTGTYEERHGIINNYMYDPLYKEFFHPGMTDPKWFNFSAEPIWITNEKQGGLSAVVNWVGSDVAIHGRTPNFSIHYDSSVPFNNRIDMILKQLDKEPSTNFLATYFEEPDGSGHKHGPNSPEVIEAIKKVDNIAKYLVEELEKRELLHQVNIILTSDHGMAEVNSSRFIYLDEFINPERYILVHSGVNAFIIPNTKEDKHEIYRNLSNVPHITVFYKEDIPDYWHYRYNRRITPIFVACDKGFEIFPNKDNATQHLGDHGYNNSLSEMHPFFIAHGPAFKQGYSSKPFSIVHIYILMCHILGITPAANDGNLAAVAHILHPDETTSYMLLGILAFITLSVMIIILYGLFRNFSKPFGYRQFYTLDC